jgi:hypothetical protein
VLRAREAALDTADYDMVGVLGCLSIRIRQGGTGELIYSQEGTRRVTGARSEDGTAIPKGAEVIVTRYERGIAYVRQWQDPADGKMLTGGKFVYVGINVRNRRPDGAGVDLPEVGVRQAVPQGGAARGDHRVRSPGNPSGEGPRHGHLSDGGKLPGGCRWS